MMPKFIPYDRFKLAVTIFLILLLILVRCSMDSDKAAVPAIEPTAQAIVETPEAEPEATTAPTVKPTAAPAVESTAESTAETACIKALPVRISGVGAKVRVVNALIPLRAGPEVKDGNILAALPIGTELEVIGLPVCTDFLTGANQWWGVRMQDGRTGYAAEGSAINPVYYLEEIR